MNPNIKNETLFNYELGVPYETIFDANEKIKMKILSLGKEMEDQKEHVERVKKESEDLRMRLIAQSVFCVNVGACLGHMLWKSLGYKEAVKYLITSHRLEHFFRVANGILASFSATYKEDMPDVGCNEMQFVLSICGIIANIAAIDQGARGIISDEQGKELIKRIIDILPEAPTKKGNSLKRSLLVVLHNLSTVRPGLKYMQTSEGLIEALSGVLRRNRKDELTILSLRLLESLTYDVPNAKYLKHLLKSINQKQIAAYLKEKDQEINSSAGNILQNLYEAEQKLSKAEIKFNQ